MRLPHKYFSPFSLLLTLLSIFIMAGCGNDSNHKNGNIEKSLLVNYDSVSGLYRITNANFSYRPYTENWIYVDEKDLPDNILVCGVDTAQQTVSMLIKPEQPKSKTGKSYSYTEDELNIILEKIYRTPGTRKEKCLNSTFEPVKIFDTPGWKISADVEVDSIAAAYDVLLFDSRDGVYGLIRCSSIENRIISTDSLSKSLVF